MARQKRVDGDLDKNDNQDAQLTVRITDKEREMLEALAISEDRSRSYIVRRLIREAYEIWEEES